MIEGLQEAAARLDAWIEREDFKGWDPHDALNSPLLKRLTLGNRVLGIACVQLFKRSPVNLRPLFGVPKGYNPKGMGLFLATYLRKYQMTGGPQNLQRAQFFAEWLQKHVSPGYSGACWGYNFDWPNRGFFAPAGTPTIVNSAFIGLAFLDCVRHADFRLPTSNLQPQLSLARSACDFILNDLNRIHPVSDELCFSYTPLDHRFVHNANLLGALLLAEVYTRTGESDLAQSALAAARYTARRQRPDGSWPYGEGRHEEWVDNFHTGFVLVSLKHIAKALCTGEFDSVLGKGYDFWKTHMFEANGVPRYYPHETYPIDAHSVAQAVLTFLEFAEMDPEAQSWAERVAAWGIENMQSPKGYFYYQVHRWYVNRIPHMRWSQAWMFKALTELCYAA